MRQRTSGDSVGELIDGRYRIFGLIAEGGMGRVYEAEHVDIGRRVALKILSPLLSEMDDVVARFRREARLATQIGNPHIVDVTDSGITEDGRFYFVMEFLDGVELGNLLKHGALEITRALRVSRQIAQAVSAAHGEGIIHRDLKPENIVLVEREGDPDFVKVLDFGIATTMNPDTPNRRLTQPGLAMGTPEYMAPEQAMAFTADARSDIYSLGALLYEMVTGQPPYQGETFTQVLVQKANTEPPPPREIRADLDPELEALIVKMMAREPDHRPQSMEEVAAAIGGLLDTFTEPANRLFTLPPVAAVAAPVSPAALHAQAVSWDQVEQSLVAHADAVFGDRLEALAETPAVEAPAASAPAVDALLPVEVPPVEEPRRRRVVGPVLVAGVVLLAVAAGYAYWTRERSTRDDDATAAPAPAAGAAINPDAAATPRPRGKRSDPRESSADRGKAAVASKPPPDASGKDAAAAPPAIGPAPRTVKQARALLRKGDVAANHERWDQARAVFARVAKGRILDEWGHLGLSRVALGTGDAGAAIAHANAGLRAGGGVPARLALANALARKGRRAAAIKQYRIVLRHEPRNKDARRGLEAALRKRPHK